MQAKPDDELGEELGENCLEDCGGKEDNGCSSTSYFSGKNFTYYQLKKISYRKEISVSYVRKNHNHTVDNF